jgi:hypothetical protein
VEYVKNNFYVQLESLKSEQNDKLKIVETKFEALHIIFDKLDKMDLELKKHTEVILGVKQEVALTNKDIEQLKEKITLSLSDTKDYGKMKEKVRNLEWTYRVVLTALIGVIITMLLK